MEGNNEQPCEPPATDEAADEVSLSPAECTALEVILAGGTHRAAAETNQRQAKWTQRLLQRPEAQAYLHQRQQELLSQFKATFGHAMLKALWVAMDELNGVDASTRLRASGQLLAGWPKWVDAMEREAVISQLREEITELRRGLEDLK